MLAQASSKPAGVGVGPYPSIHSAVRDFSLAQAHPRAIFAAIRNGVRNAALVERDRWALWLPVGLAAGIGLYFAMPVEPPLWLAIVLLIGGIALGYACIGANLTRKTFFAALASLAIGFSAACIHTNNVAAPVLAKKMGPIHLSGEVVEATPHGKGVRILLRDVMAKRLAADQTPARIRFSVRNMTALPAPGTWVNALVVLMPPPAPASPGDYDFGRWAYYQRIGAVGYAYGKPKAIASRHAPSWGDAIAARLTQLRSTMTAHIRHAIPGPNGAIAAALITGERGAIDDADRDAFRDSGLAHVLSISGLHLALAGGFFFWVVRALLALFPVIALNYPIKKWAAVAALAGAGAYLLISGCGTPALRSYIMLTVMFTAVMFDRPALTMRAVALAAALILLSAPNSLIQPGFEMSFAAVTGLIAVAEWEAAWRARHRSGEQMTAFARARRYIGGIAVASLVAGMATAPFAIFHFDRATQYGLLANVLAMPVVGFVIMPAATAAMVLMPFGLDQWALVVMGKGVGLMLSIAHWVAGLPGAASMVAAWPLAALLCVVFGGLWMAIWRGNWRWLGIAPVALGLVLAFTNVPPDVLISRDGATIAVRNGNGKLGFLHAIKDDYTAQSWLKRDGDARAPDAAMAKPEDGVMCDGYSCVVRRGGDVLIAAPRRLDAMAEDCAAAQIVIASFPTRHRCKGPQLVIDRFDVARNGATALWLGSGTPTIKTARDVRGERPWSMHKRHRHYSSHRYKHNSQ
ncbi:MAG TPA: ComEC/Rec2 family competence protein [Rhizomicrobium sp.]|nr:ComEC/Rec2 family competence protein [Rhizomicrobium sp.]